MATGIPHRIAARFESVRNLSCVESYRRSFSTHKPKQSCRAVDCRGQLRNVVKPLRESLTTPPFMLTKLTTCMIVTRPSKTLSVNRFSRPSHAN